MSTKLRHLRINSGKDWTLEYVGNKVGITKQSLHDIEKGINKPSYDVMLKLCKFYKVPHEEVEQLFAVATDETPASDYLQ